MDIFSLDTNCSSACTMVLNSSASLRADWDRAARAGLVPLHRS